MPLSLEKVRELHELAVTCRHGEFSALVSQSECAEAFAELLALRHSSPPDGQTAEDGWIEWKGGTQPVSNETLIYWKLWQNGKNVVCGPGYSRALMWTHGLNGPRFNDIVAYRIAPTPSSETKAPARSLQAGAQQK